MGIGGKPDAKIHAIRRLPKVSAFFLRDSHESPAKTPV
jgi:hypothetical protein